MRRTEVDVERLNANNAADYRADWESRYASSGGAYEEYRPAYEYGFQSASDPRYRGRRWSDVEEDLRTDFMRNNPNSSWDRAKGAVRYGWERVMVSDRRAGRGGRIRFPRPPQEIHLIGRHSREKVVKEVEVNRERAAIRRLDAEGQTIDPAPGRGKPRRSVLD